MRQMRVAAAIFAMAVVTLVLLLSVACQPPLSTAEIRTRPADTSPTLTSVADTPVLLTPQAQTLPTDTPMPTSPSAEGTSTPSLTFLSIPPTQVIQEIVVTVSPTVPLPPNVALHGLVMQAKEDLARRLSVKVDEIELVEAKEVVWPDSSLGCPQPGMAYTQVLQNGSLVRLRVGKRVYNYHSGGGRSLFLCEQTAKGGSPVPPPGLGNQ